MPNTVLIVGDRVRDRADLKAILTEKYAVAEAGDGAEALAVLRRGDCAVSAAILALEMPAMDGYALLEQMRRNPALSRIPAIAVVTDGDSERRALELGAADSIVRPFNGVVVLRRLENLINRRGAPTHGAASEGGESARDAMPLILSAAMDSSRGLMFAKGGDYRYLSCSPAFARFAGKRSVAEVVGQTDFDLFPLETAQRFRGEDMRILEGGEALLELQEPVPFGDGAHRFVSLSKFALRDSDGVNVSIYGVGRDITDVREAFDQLKLLTDTIPGGLARYEFGPRGLRTLYFSDGFCGMLGYERAEYAAMAEENPMCLVFAEDLPAVGAQVDRLLRDGTPIDIVYRLYTRDSGYIWVNMRAVLAQRIGDKIIGNAVLFDVTRAKRSEEALLVRKKEMQIAMSRIGSMICEYDVEQRTLTLPESLAGRMKTPRVISDVPDAIERGNVVEKEDQEAVRRFFQDIHRGDRTGALECRLRRSDGQVRWARLAFSSIFNAEGRPAKAVITAEDATTERDETRRAALERERLYAAVMSLVPLVISANLTRDSYATLTQAGKPPAGASGAEGYDGMVRRAAQSVPEADRGRFLDAFSRDGLLAAFASGKDRVELDHRIAGSEGALRWMRTRAIRVNNPYDGDVLEITLSQDIDEEMAYRALLQKSYDMTIENMPGFVAKWLFRDGDVLLMDANRRYLEFMGVSEEEAFGKSIIYGFTEEEKARVIDMLYQKERKQESVSFTSRACKMDGGDCWLDVKASFFEKRDGCSVYFGTLTDVTELVRVREELSDAERRALERLTQLQMFVDSGLCAIAMFEFGPNGMRTRYATDGFFSFSGYSREEYEKIAAENPMGLVCPEDMPILQKAIDEIRLHGTPMDCDFRCVQKDGSRHWFNMRGALTGREGDKALVSAVQFDVNAQREAEMQILAVNEQLSFLNDVAKDMMALPDAGESIGRMLRKILEYFGGSRAYVFEKDADGRSVSNTYEVCADGADSGIDQMQNIPIERMAEWYAVFEAGGHVLVRDRALLGEDRAEERQMLIDRGIRSLVAVPFRRDGRVLGHMGVNDLTRNVGQMERLLALGDYLSVLLARRDDRIEMEANRQALEAAERIRSVNAMMQSMMNDINGGFVRARFRSDGTMAAEYANDFVCRLLDMSREELAALPNMAVLTRVHPGDVERVRRAIGEMLASEEEGRIQFRVLSGSGEYIPMNVFGRAVRSAEGETFINVYFTDMNEEERKAFAIRETLPVVLKALMESSPDIVYAKDRTLRYLCCSPEFLRCAGKSAEADVIGKSDYDLWRQEDADAFRAADLRVLDSGEALVGWIEALRTGDNVKHTYATNKYILRDATGEIIGLYGLSRDVTAEKSAFERLKMITDNIPGGIASFEVSPGGMKLTYINEGYCRMLGYSKEEYEAMEASGVPSVTFKEDMPRVAAQLEALARDGTPLHCVYRVHNRHDDGFKWVYLRGSVAERDGDTCYIDTMLTDVTERQEMMEQLRASEEKFRIAADMSGVVLGRYDIVTGAYYHNDATLISLGMPLKIDNVPQAFIDSGSVAPESERAMLDFYDRIRAGDASGHAEARLRMRDGQFRWCRVDASVIFDTQGHPAQAIVVTTDIEQQREKEMVYKRWQQSLEEKQPEDYTLFRCNLSKDTSFDTVEGSLLKIRFDVNQKTTFNSHTLEYANRYVHPDDRAEYIRTLDSNAMLASYYRGKRVRTLDYREIGEDGDARWLRLSVELVEYPDSKEIEAYLMFENIDEAKRRELTVREQAENDPLTGILNRASFADRVERAFREAPKSARGVLFMLDIDGFKQLNDSFGHAAGDQALVDVADAIKATLRGSDLFCRFGGDEFMIFIREMSGRNDASGKAAKICGCVRKEYSADVCISASVGIALWPQDGADFETLYRRADAALYTVKGSGKNNFAFYQPWMGDAGARPPAINAVQSEMSPRADAVRRRMLVVEDNKLDAEALASMFSDEFSVFKARSGSEALIRLRHYGTVISVVLLDLYMPGMDGLAVLTKMRESAELQSIPVIVVSASEDRETALKAIRSGATDFVTKPVDAELIRLRVRSAIGKAEVERLQAQNSYLSLKNAEVTRYRAALDGAGMAVVEYDWKTGRFYYDPDISRHLAGKYDDRKLWQILLTDFVASVRDVRAMQELVHSVANDRNRTDGSLTAVLRTPDGEKHGFRMRVVKLTDEFMLADRLVLTFTNLDAAQV